ncbi:haloacid dehalogenase-like hydrolase domain-containing protein Sgpp isoform X1 [Ananas comosus]|uniref:Haloacid dehalogenase-like hydrolase domain-containing protein Sgpp isoform X1 n=1 Tax=Ananas comosus TaxID=4615 RepID=A0A6P5EJC8_ANACO|nr:haloacid dehalogenase-like hydrolase domain-containing protein Sgpp isoform X1 [Ananas comosus]
MIVWQIVIISSWALLIGPALRASHVLLLCNDSEGTSVTISVSCSKCPFSKLAPLEAILFDIDGTLCDSDPIHYYAFREMLQEIGFNNGVPITEEFFVEKISGKFNEDIGRALFPDGDHERAAKFMDDKEAMFRRLASEQLKAVDGLHKLCEWIEERGLKRAAVTNAPRANAELMISILGLTDFFQFLVVGSECERAKPFPDPYLEALNFLKASPNHTFVFEDSASGIQAGVAAGMPVVGLATRNPEKLLKEAGASLLIKDFEDPNLWAILGELDHIGKKREA